MNPEQQVAFIMSQIVCAQAEIEAMKVANIAAQSAGTLKYTEQDFKDVPLRFGINHNNVIGFFTGR